jgi:predicted transcriptional regulator of viral defense system
MTISLLLKKLRLDGKDFIVDTELKKYCESAGIGYAAAVKYLLSNGHLVRIFRGIFYVKTLEEEELGKTRYSPYELVAKGLELKGVKNWYFGLNTALKLNNMSHEYYAIDYVINDRIFRSNPMKISGYKFKFIKLATKLTEFGVVADGVRYSDLEKTVLDFIYTWRYNGVPTNKILLDVGEWSNRLSKNKLLNYSKTYPKTVGTIVEEIT